jgi:hypothetical protein
MGRRSRARDATDAPDGPTPREIMRSGYARGEARNEEIRRNLEPLAEGERPGAVTVGAIVALVLAVANTVALALGETVRGDDVTAPGIGLSVVLFVCAIFMWQARYWAVLGFQALLVIQIIISAAALMVAPTVWTALVLLIVTVAGCVLFWKLIRALARLQMPEA